MCSSPTIRTTPSDALPLAAELYDRIVDFLHDDWRALVACVLTGPLSPLTSCAEYHLSCGVDLPISESQVELFAFLHVFDPEAPLARRRLIHAVHIHGTRTRNPDAILPVHIDLSHLPNLRVVTLSYLLIESNENLILFLSELPALENLALEGLVACKPTTPTNLLPYRNPDSGASEMAALYGRLKSLRLKMYLRAQTISLSSPYDMLYRSLLKGRGASGSRGGLRSVALRFQYTPEWRRWMDLLGEDNPSLEHLALTTPTPMDEPAVIQTGKPRRYRAERTFLVKGNLYGYVSRFPSLRSLYVRYYPWEHVILPPPSPNDENGTFLRSMVKVFRALSADPPENTTCCPNLESVELVLSIPPDARADGNTFRALAQSLSPALWPRLTRVKVAVEPVPPMDIRDAALLLRVHPLSGTAQEAEALEQYAEVARRALAALSDPMGGREVEVVVCTQPSSSVP